LGHLLYELQSTVYSLRIRSGTGLSKINTELTVFFETDQGHLTDLDAVVVVVVHVRTVQNTEYSLQANSTYYYDNVQYNVLTSHTSSHLSSPYHLSAIVATHHMHAC
jgi:hypothetical protein